MKAAEAARGPFDILVANAGGAEPRPFGKTEPAQFQRLFDLNVLGIVHAARAVLPGMVARKFGRIVAVASTAGLKGYPYVTAYCTSKHAVVGLVRSLAVETAKTGVTVNAVCPSFTDTDLVRESVAAITRKTGKSHEEVIAQYVKDVPMARLIQPQEVAAAVLYLCSVRRGRRDRHRDDRCRRRNLNGRCQRRCRSTPRPRSSERPADHEDELRLWLRLLTCTTLIENEIRQRLRTEFDVTLPRFDLMAQLDQAPNGMTLGELSQRMMVSNGNVTGLVERLVSLNLVERKPAPNDRRAMIVTLTSEGRRTFRSLARTHEGLDRRNFRRADANREVDTLMKLLAKTKNSARKAIEQGAGR